MEDARNLVTDALGPVGDLGYYSSIEGWVAAEEAELLAPPAQRPLPVDEHWPAFRQAVQHRLKFQPDAALSLLLTLQSCFEAAGDPVGLVATLAELALVGCHADPQNGLSKADWTLHQADGWRTQCDPTDPLAAEALARWHHVQGLVLAMEGQFGRAMQSIRQAQQLAPPDSLEAARLLDTEAAYAAQVGQWVRAQRLYQLAYRRKQQPLEQAVTGLRLGRLLHQMHQFEAAQTLLENTLAQSVAEGNGHRARRVRCELAALALSQGQVSIAKDWLEQAQSPLCTDAVPVTVLDARVLLTHTACLIREGQDELARLTLTRQVLPLLNTLAAQGHRIQGDIGVAYQQLGQVAGQTGQHTAALEALGEALSAFKLVWMPGQQARTRFLLAQVYLSMDQKGFALSSLKDAIRDAERAGDGPLLDTLEGLLAELDTDQWMDVIDRRVRGEPLSQQAHTLADALSALPMNDPADPDQRSRHSLVALLRVGQALAAERDLDRLLPLITQETADALDADRCTVFLLDSERNELWSKVATALSGLEEIRVPAHLGLVGYVSKTAETVNIADAYADPRFNPEVDRRTGYRTQTLLCMPIRNRQGQVIGVVQVLNKRHGQFDRNDEDLLMALGATAGTAIENALLANEQRLSFESFITTLSRTIDARDPITAGHSERVASYSLLIGETLKMDTPELEALNIAALLHDIGKIGIREEILVKDGRLTAREYAHIQKHAFYTYEILKNIRFDRHLAHVPEIAAAHHEKMDGSGYFRGLKGPEIPFSGRILAVSDVFDAITSRRHYRNRMPFQRVLGLLRRDSSRHFDPQCIQAFFTLPLNRLLAVLVSDPLVRPQGVDPESLINQIDSRLTVAELEHLLSKTQPTPVEAKLIEIFHRLYHVEGPPPITRR